MSVWEYNSGLNNALLKTLSGNNLSLQSGYFSPTVSILLDVPDAKVVNAEGKVKHNDITESQLNQIQNNFSAEVGQNLSAAWVKTYIGSVALANHVVGSAYKDNPDIKKFVDESKSNNDILKVNPSGALPSMLIPKGKTVWSELVFNQPLPSDDKVTYFVNHSHKSKLEVLTKYASFNGNSYYGEYFSGSGEGMNPYLNLPFMKDNFDNIFKNVESSDYSYDSNAGILREQSSLYSHRYNGAEVKYKDAGWVVAEDSDYVINLYSKKFIIGVLKNGKIVESTSGAMESPPILDVIHATNLKTFGTGQENGINSAQYMRTQSFDFIPSNKDVDVGIKFIGVKNGVMTPYVYENMVNNDGTISLKLSKTTLDEGETIQVPVFATLSKAVWSVSDKNLVWSKKFIGADPSLYNKGSLVQSLKEQLLNNDSKNLKLSSDVKTGTLQVGKATGAITNQNVTFKVPFESQFLSATTINKQAVLEEFNMNADLTVTEKGETASAAQYIKEKKVGGYDPYYKDYKNTLVDNNGKLQVANGTTLTDYTSSSIVESVSLTGIIMNGVRYLSNGVSSSSNEYKVYQYQSIKPPAVVAPFTNGAPPILNANNAIIADVASNYQSIPTALELFDSLQKHLRDIAVKNVWYMIIFIILGSAILLSVTTLLAHIFAHAPLSNMFFSRMLDITSIDFLAIFSLGVVRISDGAENKWVRTAITSITLGVCPVAIFGIMSIYGLI